jgi:hypothetical protein
MPGGSRDPFDKQRRHPPRGGIGGTPVLENLLEGSTLVRIHRSDHPADGFNARPPDGMRGGRFDSIGGVPGVLYAADSIEGAVAEVLLRDVPLADEKARAIPLRQVLGRVLSVLTVTRPLKIAAVHGAASAAIGEGLWLSKSEPCDYPLTREWAAAIREREPKVAGLVWRARHDEDRLAYALYENRAGGALTCVRSVPIDAGAGLEAVRKVLLAHGAVIE